MRARDKIRYQIIGPDDGSDRCRMTIVEISAGWHKGVHDRKALIDATLEAIAGYRYTFEPGKKTDADVFSKASIEASSNLGNGIDIYLIKAEASAEYNAFKDRWKLDSNINRPNFRLKESNVEVESKDVDSFKLNGKIAAISITRKNCN